MHRKRHIDVRNKFSYVHFFSCVYIKEEIFAINQGDFS